MFGCESLPAAAASRANRSLNSASSRALANWLAWMSLMATGRPMAGSNPRYTTPMAPRPNSSKSWYGPIVCITMASYYNVQILLTYRNPDRVDVGAFAADKSCRELTRHEPAYQRKRASRSALASVADDSPPQA